MSKQITGKIGLNPEEQELLKRIDFELSGRDRESHIATLQSAGALTESLLRRGAVPDIRLRYFDDPELYVGGHGRSRMQTFESNGTQGRAMFRHGNFLKYLRYFISGPNLPESTITGFCSIVEEDAGTSGDVLDQLRRFTRSEVRRGLPHARYELPEEFFKLALECGLDLHLARSVREAAQSAR